MNKTTKGAVAAGAAAVLLLGGAGSYAYWNSEATAPGGTITAGTLTITANATPPVWTDVSVLNPKTAGPIDIATFKMVPGDILQYNATFTIAATGNNLQATLAADQASVTYGGGLSAANVTTNVTSSIGGVATPVITSANNGNTVNVQVKVAFDPATSGVVGQSGTVNLTAFRVALQQTRT